MACRNCGRERDTLYEAVLSGDHGGITVTLCEACHDDYEVLGWIESSEAVD